MFLIELHACVLILNATSIDVKAEAKVQTEHRSGSADNQDDETAKLKANPRHKTPLASLRASVMQPRMLVMSL